MMTLQQNCSPLQNMKVRCVAVGNIVVNSRKGIQNHENEMDKDEYKKMVFSKADVTDIQYFYPLKIIVPMHASQSNCKWIYFITYGGGLVQGDQVQISMELTENCCVLVTSQSSTKVYNCDDGIESRQFFNYTVGNYSLLSLLPDPVVCYENSLYAQQQVVYLLEFANLIMVDWLTAGRVARGECWKFHRLKSLNKIYWKGKLVVSDAISLSDTETINLSDSMGKYQAVAFCVFIGPKLESFWQKILKNVSQTKLHNYQPDPALLMSASPLLFESSEAVQGCILRIAALRTTRIYNILRELFEPLYGVFGGNPFEHK